MKMRKLAGVVVMMGGAALVAACSLGEGKTPACDPEAAPGTESACLQLAECDDGHGGIAAGNEACCLRRASYEYATCEDVVEPSDFRSECAGITEGCCRGATNLFDVCMTEGLTTTTTTGGGGGATASGGGGGGPGGGAAAGGGGAGGN